MSRPADVPLRALLARSHIPHTIVDVLITEPEEHNLFGWVEETTSKLSRRASPQLKTYSYDDACDEVTAWIFYIHRQWPAKR